MIALKIKLTCFTAAALVALTLANAPLSAAAEQRPNFIFIITDNPRWDTLGAVQREQGERGRYPWLETPNMDRIAADGVRFRNAFVTASLCSPSRASFLTGQYNNMKNRLQRIHGTVEVRSEIEKGTTVEIFQPIQNPSKI